MLIIEKKQFG